jgi:3-deoxy-7-phosphoheptulonate synthase
VNVADQRVLMSPTALREQVHITESLFEFVAESRGTIERIIDRQDHRLVVVVGPLFDPRRHRSTRLRQAT